MIYLPHSLTFGNSLYLYLFQPALQIVRNYHSSAWSKLRSWCILGGIIAVSVFFVLCSLDIGS